jgi:hypothetical protein
MNCCNDYTQCHQGANCPVRAARSGQLHLPPDLRRVQLQAIDISQQPPHGHADDIAPTGPLLNSLDTAGPGATWLAILVVVAMVITIGFTVGYMGHKYGPAVAQFLNARTATLCVPG